MEDRLKHIEQNIDVIMKRNARVEADKAWETSLFRMLSLGAAIYLAAIVLLYLIRAENIFLAALVPVVGFILSVQTFPALKRWWIKKFISDVERVK
jgi:hypothetical protein